MNYLFLGLLLVSVLPGFGQTYTTNFPNSENPISEGGRWTNGGAVGLDWLNVETTGGSPGTAYSSAFVSGYNDCIAVLSGFPADQTVQATVYRRPGYTAPSTHEVELLLRFKITAHSARGYEMDFWFGGSTLQVVRWDGPVGSFDTNVPCSGPGPQGLVTGDVVKAQIVGSTITVYKNGNLITTCNDTKWTDGNPGIGFFVRPGGTLKDYCFSSFTATGNGTGTEGNLPPATPARFSLGQNCPNPFNSGTMLRYDLPSRSHVTLNVYDMLGREVAALVNENKPAGNYAVRFDGSALTSGIFTAQLTAGRFVQTRKMLLLK